MTEKFEQLTGSEDKQLEQRLGIFWTPLVTIVAGTIAMAWISIINEAPLTMLGDSGGILRSVLFGYTDKFRTVFYL